jgi:nitrogen-specific signal transduction histidine kinase
MKFADWKWVKGLKKLLGTPRPEPARQAERIAAMQLHIVLPAKLGVIAVVLYYLFKWFDGAPQDSILAVVIKLLQRYFMLYMLCTVVAGAVLFLWRRFPPGLMQWLVFTLGLLDGIFMAGLTFITGGFESIAYWIFPGLIVLNALSIPLAMPQIVLNLLLSIFYLSSGILTTEVLFPELWTPSPNAFSQLGRARPDGRSTNSVATNVLSLNVISSNAAGSAQSSNTAALPGLGRHGRPNRLNRVPDLPYSTTTERIAIEPELPRIFLLWLLTICCYGVQVLAERQRRTMEEVLEFSLREWQLRSAGRLAAEFAHQIKNPLAIINNAAFSMQRALKAGRNDVSRQIEIIQEEVERSDRIVTQIMGYAQLTEGRVEKLNVADELDNAIGMVFPPAVDCGTQIERSYGRTFPPLLMQKRQLSDILVNVLQNAREALNGKGLVSVSAVFRPDGAIEIAITDNGPGISSDNLGRIFEAYFTTREKGTGLGLAIVRNNVELYAGTVRVESELGKGARFILTFPAKASPADPR